MRILKYVMFLLFLAFVAVIVFIATQKGNYQVVRSIYIKSSRETVFNYLNDYRNWDQWGYWKEEVPGAKFSYSVKSSGSGSFYQWKSADGEIGEIKTVFDAGNDSIAQQFNIDGNTGTYNWKLKDSANGTKVTWRATGQLGFIAKIKSVFEGGIDKIVTSNLDKSLTALDVNLDYEINTFSIAVNGKVVRPGVKYLMQTITSKISNQPNNVSIMLEKMRNFFDKNKIRTAGNPFVIYHSYDQYTGLTRFSVCMPINEEIFIAEGSDIQFGSMEPITAVKSTLKGDYSHLPETWRQTVAYVTNNNFTRVAPYIIEQFSIGPETTKQPSKWITEMFVPIENVVVTDTIPKPIRAAATQTLQTPERFN